MSKLIKPYRPGAKSDRTHTIRTIVRETAHCRLSPTSVSEGDDAANEITARAARISPVATA